MRRATLAALFAVLALAAPAQAADVSVHFDAGELTAGQNVDEFYLTNPGFIFGQGVENPQGGEFPTYSSCATSIEPRGNAPSAPNVARLACGGTPEFPDPPVLFGKFTTATRTRVAMRVGDAGTGGHQMRLSIFDGQGRLLNRSPTVAIATNGTTLQTAAGQPEVTYWVLEEMGNSSSPGIWVDDVVVDTPAVAGQPQFGLVRTAGKGTLVVRQGLNATTDITLYRTNSSAGNVDFAITGQPPGIDADLEPSPNGRSFTVTAAIQADATGPTDPVIVITGTPQDSSTGTVTQRVSIPVRITRAITLSAAETPGGVAMPTCGPVRVAYSVASDVGPAAFSMAPLPPGVVPTIDGVDIGSHPGVTGSGAVSLDFRVPQQVTADVNSVLTLTGKEEYDPVVAATAGTCTRRRCCCAGSGTCSTSTRPSARRRGS